MAAIIGSERLSHRLARAVFGVSLLLGGVTALDFGVGIVAARAQGAGAVEGVAPWQAQRAIDDYIERFMVAQRRFGRAKLGHENFSVRVKVEGLTRVYNKDVGAIWVAQFSGAIVPTVVDPNAEQGYAHALLKIYLDKDKGVQVVVNEGQGVWTMTQKSAILAEELPDDPGGWKEWGGPGDPPEASHRTATGDPKVERSPPTGSLGSHPAGDPLIQQLAAEVSALGARVAELRKAGASAELQKAQEAWQAAQERYRAALPH
ncbi:MULTISPECIES: hypothetical protein [Bradyrhizobium]|uniref:hypothetical protein n=1 Tax=Bradyrhizobium TaxID=374 RepID=UPI00155216F1|nr:MULTISPECIES: hypothetical protein [Bradyrhizobium]NPU10473.1 hypothetical protein [Bradyrhizobium aeschynomenes]